MAHISKIVPGEGEQPGFAPGRVAHAWVDPAFRARLLENCRAACEELGITLNSPEKVLARVSMTGTTKLSVEKALDKIREADMQKSETTRMDEEIAKLDKSIKRMRAQRLRLEHAPTRIGQPSAARPSFFAWLFGRKG